MEFGENETKHVKLEQFLHAFASRGFVSVSWAFLFVFPSSRLDTSKQQRTLHGIREFLLWGL